MSSSPTTAVHIYTSLHMLTSDIALQLTLHDLYTVAQMLTVSYLN